MKQLKLTRTVKFRCSGDYKFGIPLRRLPHLRNRRAAIKRGIIHLFILNVTSPPAGGGDQQVAAARIRIPSNISKGASGHIPCSRTRFRHRTGSVPLRPRIRDEEFRSHCSLFVLFMCIPNFRYDGYINTVALELLLYCDVINMSVVIFNIRNILYLWY